MMINTPTDSALTHSSGGNSAGFTLIELVIAMFITTVVGISVVMSHQSQVKASMQVRQMAEMQQQIRSVFALMAEDIRMAGYNRVPGNPNPDFGILDVRAYAIPVGSEDIGSPVAGGSPSLWLAYDFDRLCPNEQANSAYGPRCAGASFPTTGNGVADEPSYAYLLFDEVSGDGTVELGRDVYDSDCGDSRDVMAENIESIGFAFAFDNDGDNFLDGVNGAVYWAVDTGTDNKLDTNLDSNMDGLIDLDDVDSNSTDAAVGTPLPGGMTVSVDKIRAVRIWLLATATPDRHFRDFKTYVVGNRIIDMTDSANHAQHPPNQRRLVMEHIVDCRNMWPVDKIY